MVYLLVLRERAVGGFVPSALERGVADLEYPLHEPRVPPVV